jgi:NAD(P)-dependent dehydrogenase (short-subunit alcohol dehydrogenase family)
VRGKVVIVTGAGSGIGRATALRFIAEGAHVIANDWNAVTLAETAALAADMVNGAEGYEMGAVVGDVSNVADVDRLVSTALSVHGRLDVLANVAGVLDSMGPVHEVSDSEWQRVLGVNLNGPFHTIRRAIPALLASKGNIVNVASIAGISGAKAGAAYTTSKHGLIGLTRSTAYLYARDGVRCNVVCPGGVETNIMSSTPSINTEGMARLNPMMAGAIRTGSSDEIAALVVFLASDEASLVNGAVVTADAGWTAG